MERLSEYERKRRPGRTPEPPAGAGEAPAPAARPIFVVQRHAARRLHYDLRLERDGALASWAVPRGLPLDPGERRLAVHVEDHPLAYADFEGEIPAGEYGAGKVELWDRGTYELVEEKRDGGLTVRLEGGRLRGLWTLVPAALDGDARNWLLLRKRDDGTTAPEAAPAASRPAPMLATLADRVPTGPGWLFEVKLDGYRTLARLAGGEAVLWSRNGNELTSRFATIARALPVAVRTPNCVLDGEVCALDELGRPSFSAMQSGSGALVYYVFDLLELDGEPVIDRPLHARRALLEGLLGASPCVRLSEGFPDGEALLDLAIREQLEGVIAKRVDAPYRVGRRSREWLKVKTHEEQEFVIVGWTRGAGRRAGGIGALVLAVHEPGGLRWVGNCGTGFDARELDRLQALLGPLAADTSPLAVVPRMPRVRAGDVTWVEPRLVCQVEFAEWTRDGRLRAPSYRGLREDKRAAEVVREVPAEVGAREREVTRGARSLRLTNLDKLFFPADGRTKGDLLAYYEAIAPVLVPHLRDRLFTMKRYPNGIEGKHFFQKDAPSHMPDWIETRRVETVSRGSGRERTIDYPLVNDELALLWMVNMGCIDLNVVLDRVDRPDRPDAVLFDLDPTPEAGFGGAVRAALLVRAALEQLGLVGYPKTSGSDGIHVLVPIERRHGWADAHLLASTVAGALARTYPDEVTTEFLKAKRRGVLVDANQNGPGRTIASVYSVRPHPGAPVSTPLEWGEVIDGLDPRSFTPEAVLARVAERGDLFAPVLAGGQSLAAALDRLG
ncbi:MAG: DNA ligase D [Thermoleophilia bacterium]